MKLKDLLKGRDKLRKYDELKKWKDIFSFICRINNLNGYDKITRNLLSDNGFGVDEKLPDHIRKIILDALDAEINKMEEG